MPRKRRNKGGNVTVYWICLGFSISMKEIMTAFIIRFRPIYSVTSLCHRVTAYAFLTKSIHALRESDET